MVNIDDQSDKERCSRETIWNEIDIYSNNDNNNGDDDNSMNCDNKPINSTNNGQWNKSCMCTGPDVNGSWIPCNSAQKLAFLNNFMKMSIFIVIIFYVQL